MNRITRILLVSVFLLLCSLTTAWADVPTNMNVQGRLTDGAGTPVPAGIKAFTFKIFDAPVGGVEIWPAGPGETQAINSDDDGLWSAEVGSNTPLTETVFQDTSRWLEITVDDGVNPPETLSRVRLNTNPYTYRSASSQSADALEGMSLADLHGEHVNVAGDSMTGALQVPQVMVGNSGLNGEIHLWADGDPDPGVSLFTFPGAGGAWRTFDGSHNITTTAVPSPYGEGGTFAVLGTASGSLGQAFVVEGNSDGVGNPQVVIAGSNSVSTFSTSVAGSGSVELPVDAVEASEIVDEPGLATSGASYSVIVGDVSDTVVASATITFPAAGYALIFAEANLYAYIYSIYVDCWLDRNGVQMAEWYWDGGDKDSQLDQHQCRILVDTIPSAGVYTYDLRVQHFNAGLEVNNQKLIVLYVPTAYGSVTLPVAMGGHPSSDGAVLTEESAANNPVLSRQTAIQASIDANQARMDREMASMRARLEALEASLAKSGSAIATDDK